MIVGITASSKKMFNLHNSHHNLNNAVYIRFTLMSVECFGLSTVKEKLMEIILFKFPSTLKELKTCLGMTGYLRNYIP